MSTVCLLINTDNNAAPKNHTALANALLKHGSDVYLGAIESMHMEGDKIYADCHHLKTNMSCGEIPERYRDRACLNHMDFCWVLGFGKREAFLDYIELMWILSQSSTLINSPEALMFANNKYSTQLFCPDNCPETYASSDFEYLWNKYKENNSSTWIIKPPAESHGRDVYLLKPEDKNARVIIQSMTGNKNNRFCLLQKYITEIQKGEKRVLLAGGKPICQYGRRPSNDDHRTNIHQNGLAFTCELSDNERSLLEALGKKLLAIGAYFVGVDMAYPYIVELNVVNPGGLNTIYELCGQDFGLDVVREVLSSTKESSAQKTSFHE
ncbi:MAG: hypothetical protein COA42_21220 [Alteromonadaceae bacterium]|nr:MAG: hypothetical protein COA42_21220 [Alteromonadaceae bacterium]